jgi:hypothetical protein
MRLALLSVMDMYGFALGPCSQRRSAISSTAASGFLTSMEPLVMAWLFEAR